eukprot:XP_014622838.1 uncharacterized protein LOC100793630 isoform X1 [Glycine max]
MRALLVQQGLVEALDGEIKLEKMMADGDKKALLQKAYNAIILSLGDKVLRQVSKETTAVGVWSKLEVLDIDSVGTFTMCHEALKYLKKGGEGRSNSSSGGSIINISATLHYTASWYQIHVSAAKAAVDATTRNLALEWGTDYDIRVNGIAPGPISGTPGMSKLAPDEISSKARDYMPLYKLGEKWDIAMAALFLASDAGKFVNGDTMIVDGGLWLSRPRHLEKEAVKQVSRSVEKRSRNVPVGVPKSKL